MGHRYRTRNDPERVDRRLARCPFAIDGSGTNSPLASAGTAAEQNRQVQPAGCWWAASTLLHRGTNSLRPAGQLLDVRMNA
jgi:hypothetical protein